MRMSVEDDIDPLMITPLDILLMSFTFTTGSTVFCVLLSLFGYTSPLPWQFLYFLPLPQGHGSLRPTCFSTLTGAFGFCSPLVVKSLRPACILLMSVCGLTAFCGCSSRSRRGTKALNRNDSTSWFRLSSMEAKRL